MKGLLRFFRITVLLLPAGSAAVFGQGFTEISGETLYTDNLSRSQHAEQAKEDASISLSAVTGYHFQPGIYTGAVFTGTLTSTAYNTYHGMNNYAAGLGFSINHKFGLGEQAPVLALALNSTRNEFKVAIRDTWIHGIDLSLTRRMSDTLNLRGSLQYEKRDGDHNTPKISPPAPPGTTIPAPLPLALPMPGTAWSYDSLSFALQADVDLTAAMWASGNYRLQDGDVVSSSLSNSRILSVASAIANDPVFSPATIAYRLPALTQALALDLNRAVLDAGTLYMGLEYQYTRGKGGINYPVRNIRAGFIYSF